MFHKDVAWRAVLGLTPILFIKLKLYRERCAPYVIRKFYFIKSPYFNAKFSQSQLI